mmetsp:Transcript_22313/g.36695  ORF Transcript_22313/g.36695 Transcript_22313/m.36695 type:complete len:136 (+) Transcript_22313:473-880(+)
MINKSRSAVTATTAAAGESSQSSTPRPERTGKHAISSLLMQRAIQTQLYYLADLRDEPTYMWMREFLNHGHLDDKGRFNELDGLRCDGGWRVAILSRTTRICSLFFYHSPTCTATAERTAKAESLSSCSGSGTVI